MYSTVFGPVNTRGSRTRNSIAESVFLKDNPDLKPVFEWLKNNEIRSVKDVALSDMAEAFDEIEFQHEVKWDVDEKFWIISFHNVKPLEADFQQGIPKYFQLFKQIINRAYSKNQKHQQIIKEIDKIEVQLQRFREEMKSGLGRKT